MADFRKQTVPGAYDPGGFTTPGSYSINPTGEPGFQEAIAALMQLASSAPMAAAGTIPVARHVRKAQTVNELMKPTAPTKKEKPDAEEFPDLEKVPQNILEKLSKLMPKGSAEYKPKTKEDVAALGKLLRNKLEVAQQVENVEPNMGAAGQKYEFPKTPVQETTKFPSKPLDAEALADLKWMAQHTTLRALSELYPDVDPSVLSRLYGGD